MPFLQHVATPSFVPAIAHRTSARSGYAALAAVLAIAAALRLYGAQITGLWTDELFTDAYTQMGLRFIWTEGLGSESNPPLHFTIVALWRVVAGSSELALRLPSVGFSLASIYGAYRLALLLFRDDRVALLASALLALAPVHMFYGEECRAYALQGAALTAAMVGLAGLLEDPRAKWPLLLYAIGVLGALYAHITSVFALVAFNLGALAWLLTARPAVPPSAVRNWIVLHLAIGVLALPLLWTLRNGTLASWIVQPDRHGFESLVAEFVLGTAPMPEKIWIARVVVMLLGFCLWQGTWWRHRQALILLGLVPALVLGGMLLCSQVKPVVLTRTIAWLAVPVSIALAEALVAGRRVMLTAGLVLAVVLAVADRRHASLAKEDWPGLLGALPGLSSGITILGPTTPLGAVARYAPLASAPVRLDGPALGMELENRITPVKAIGIKHLAALITTGHPVWLLLRGGSITWADGALQGLPSPDLVMEGSSANRIRAMHWGGFSGPQS